MASGLSEEELEERDRLLEAGFSNWNRRDFNAFVRACEKYGRHALSDIAREVDGKSEEEIRAYADVFWKRYRGPLPSCEVVLPGSHRYCRGFRCHH